MIKKYFLPEGLDKKGPYSLQELKEKEISIYTLIWMDGMEEWTPAGKIDELKELFEAETSFSTQQQEIQQGNVSNDKSVYIATAIAIAVVIFAFIYFAFSNKDSGNDKNKFGNDVVKIDEDKRRLQELEEKEKERQAEKEKLTTQNKEYRNNWNRYIGYTTNKYRVKTFGGISNLKVTATNKTDKIIDEVVIAIEYYKASGDLYTTKDVTITNIQPFASGTVKVDNTSRGNRIEAGIRKITSRSINFCYNSRGNSSGDDPWYCR